MPRGGLAIRTRVPTLKHLLSFGPVDGARDLLAELPHAAPAPLVDESHVDDIGFLAYTGGTTGRSKGVMLPHRVLVAMSLAIAADWDWPPEIRYLAATPISHAAGITLFPVMLRGGFSRLVQGFDAEAYCRVVQEERITATFLVPTLIYALIDAPALRAKYDLGSLQTIVYGAAPMSPDRLREGMKIFGQVFVQLYGQTEAPQIITTLRKIDHDENRPERLGSCGRANPMVEVKLFDAEMREVEAGQPGEICVRGTLVMDGYWKREEATAETLRGGWLHTGDVAVQDADGYFYIVDRTKDMIISGGFNIYPREVEDALMAHPSVAFAAVIGIPDDKWGEAVKAFVVLKPGTYPQRRGIAGACEGAARRAMVAEDHRFRCGDCGDGIGQDRPQGTARAVLGRPHARRGVRRSHAGLSAVIARSPCDEAIQFLPSLWLLDCRVASLLAMTGRGRSVNCGRVADVRRIFSVKLSNYFRGFSR